MKELRYLVPRVQIYRISEIKAPTVPTGMQEPLGQLIHKRLEVDVFGVGEFFRLLLVPQGSVQSGRLIHFLKLY